MPGHNLQHLSDIEAKLEDLKETVETRRAHRELVEQKLEGMAKRQEELSKLREMLAAV